jgi:hypothetical protein
MTAPTWIQTASGRAFDLNNPDPFAIVVEDLAHHLAHLCRFTGACRKFYSVAQHCCIVAGLLPPRLRLAGLLHDAAEAYIGDWSSPMKALVRVLAPGLIEQVHHNVERAVEARFGLELTGGDRAEIKYADLVALATEKRDLMPDDARPGWAASACVMLPPPLEKRIVPWSSTAAKFMFDHRYKLALGVETDAEITPLVTPSSRS